MFIMKKTKGKDLNIDMLGNKWLLAPGGHEQMNRCQSKLLESHLELQSIGALFCCMENAELSGEDLNGTGLTLQRISKRLSKISNILSYVTCIEKEND